MLVSTGANKFNVFPGILFRRPLPGQSFSCCGFPIRELLPLAAHGFEQFWILKRIAENQILLLITTRTRRSTISTRWSRFVHATTSTSKISLGSRRDTIVMVVKYISGRLWNGDWSVSVPRVKSRGFDGVSVKTRRKYTSLLMHSQLP